MKKIKNLLLVGLLLITVTVLGQAKISGTILDETGQPLPGASVVEKGTTNGTATDFDGKFALNTKSSKGYVIVSFVGYLNKTIAFTGGNLGRIQLVADDNTLDEVVIVGTGVVDLVKDRQTPIAVSTIKAGEIQAKAGNMEFPEIMRSTPSVYVTKQGGGFGDSRINLRGFDQSNTAFLLNGQPINGMEDGKIYWSNWSGVMDVANAVQIQRGLGSSKLAISSVGGTVNIVTKSTDRKEGGFVKGLIGNDAYYKGTVAYSTGKNADSPFGVTALFTHWQGDGYNDGTKGQGQNYFLSIGYQINDNNNLNFLITGAPQWHDQNYAKPVSDYLKFGRKYNDNWGYDNGSYRSERTNYYHKPVANLNWDLKINEKASLSTVLYASWGRGGGTGGYTKQDYKLKQVDAVKLNNNQIDFDAIRALNSSQGNTLNKLGYAIRASVNNHQWYGLVSNFNLKLNDNWNWNIGVDGRHYNGEHFRQFIDFLGFEGVNRRSTFLGNYTVNKTFEAKPWSALFSPNGDRNQRYNWDYEETIQYIGGFTQFEYKDENMSGYIQAALSTQGHERKDYSNYKQGNTDSKKVNNTGYNLKGGLNFKLDEKNNVFFNAGYYSRQPFHDNIYLNFRNDIDPATKNEKIGGIELGYGHRGDKFAANVNLYATTWNNRVFRNTFFNRKISSLTNYLFKNIIQEHKGIEIDFTYKPIEDLELKGYGSFGDWRYGKGGTLTVYDDDLNVVNSKLNLPTNIDIDDFKVGDAAQTTFGFGASYKFLDGFRVDADWNYFANLYSGFVPKASNDGAIKLPDYDLFDLGLSYKFGLGETSSLTLRGNINNLFGKVYISDSRTNIAADSNPANNWKGINVDNSVYFGYGMTWNFGATFDF